MKNFAPIKAILDASQGQFVTIHFVKADGSFRSVNGKIAPLSPSMENKDQYVNIMLSKKEGDKPAYRNVNMNTVSSVRMNGKTYIIE